MALLQPTNAGLNMPDPTGWTPMPTQGPGMGMGFHEPLLVKRALSTACGIFSGFSGSPEMTCDGGYCAWNSGINAFGCCANTYTATDNNVYLTNCNFHNTCGDYVTNCGTNCPPFESSLSCTLSNYPYCVKYLYPYDGGVESNYDCWNYPYSTLTILPLNEAAASTSSVSVSPPVVVASSTSPSSHINIVPSTSSPLPAILSTSSALVVSASSSIPPPSVSVQGGSTESIPVVTYNPSTTAPPAGPGSASAARKATQANVWAVALVGLALSMCFGAMTI